jgi:hypothetical protein
MMDGTIYLSNLNTRQYLLYVITNKQLVAWCRLVPSSCNDANKAKGVGLRLTKAASSTVNHQYIV